MTFKHELNVNVLSKNIIYSNKYLTLKSEEILLSKDNDQLKTEYYSIDCPNFVVGIVIKNDQLLMISQYRHPINKINLEFVAGMIEKDETPEQTIIKELKEEAGIITTNPKKIGYFNPLSGLSSNIGNVFLVEQFSETSSTLEEFEEFSNLQKFWIPISSFEEKLKLNQITDGIVLMSWCLYLGLKNEKL